MAKQSTKLLKKLLLFSLFFSLLFSSSIPAQKSYYSLQERIQANDLFLKAYYHYNNMEYAAAIELFRKSLDYLPLNNRARFWLGKAYLMSGNKELAISEWETLVRLNSADILLKQKLQQLYTESFIDKNIDLQNSLVFLKYLYVGKGISSIKTDSSNNLYLANYLKDTIEIRDPNFNLLKSFSSSVKKPLDIALKDNLLAVSSFGNDKVLIFNANTGSLTYEIGGFGITEGKMAGPSGIFLHKDKLYVSEIGNSRVQVFRLNPKPTFLLEFGKKGRKPGEFFLPTDVLFYENNIWVCDQGNHRLQVFDESGNFLFQVGAEALKKPRKLFIYQKKLYVLDEVLGLLRYQDKSKNFITIKKRDQDIQKPIGSYFDNNGVLYISDFFNPRMSAFIPDKMKLASLKLESLLTLNTAYPKITVKLRVQDLKGRDVKGLLSKNFKVYLEGQRAEASLAAIEPENDRLSIVTLYRNSSIMKKYHNEVIDFFRKNLNNLKYNDRVSISHYNNISVLMQPFTNQRLKIIKAIEDAKYSKRTKNSLGNALYQGITRNLNNSYHNFILLLEDGKSKTDFKKHSLEVIANYAKRNGVPIFVLAFEEGSLTSHLKYLAKQSGGRYINFFKSNNVYSLFNMMRKNTPLFYALTFNSAVYPKIDKNRWVNILIELNYSSLYGAEKTGFFVP